MGRDTIQLEDAVSTISQEYLLKFASEYYIPENLHPELSGPRDHIVDFPESKVPLDFSNEDAPPPVTQGAEVRVHGPTAVEQEIPVTDDAEAMEAAVDPDLEKEHSARGGKSLADMSVDTEPIIYGQETQEPPVATQSVSDPDPLSYADNIFSLFGGCRSSKEAGVARIK
ncbi:hypothetical protein Tco_1179574 [Tanacetum coccineum]